MQTLTIRVDDSYMTQILNFLQQIPKNKREIFHHQRVDISHISQDNKKSDFLEILEKGPTLSINELNEWEENIESGYKSWQIEEF
jgi:hypothetical protein